MTRRRALRQAVVAAAVVLGGCGTGPTHAPPDTASDAATDIAAADATDGAQAVPRQPREPATTPALDHREALGDPLPPGWQERERRRRDEPNALAPPQPADEPASPPQPPAAAPTPPPAPDPEPEPEPTTERDQKPATPATPDPTPKSPPFVWEASALPDAVRDAMTGRSWEPGCPVGLDDLRVVALNHYGFDGKVYTGELVVHRNAVGPLKSVFATLYAERFPIKRIQRIDRYDGDDDASMAANNTSAFNCRRTTGGSQWSQHSYGTAIDINPIQNPYVRGSTVLPPKGSSFLDRSGAKPGMIVDGGAVVAAFDRIGWGWGGRWQSLADYMHFSESGR